MTDDARWTSIFDRIALFLTLFGFLLREWTPGSPAGAGLNLFIHLLFWVALTLWFAGRATASGADYRFTGFEFAFLAFAIVALISVQRASFRLAALDQAMTWLSFALFFVLCVQLVGRRLLLSTLLATLVAISVHALIQKFLLFPALRPVAEGATVEMARRILTSEPSASFLGPNQLAGFLALVLPVLAGTLLDTRDFKVRGAALALGLIALVLTGSLGGWVALACGGLAMLALGKVPHRKLLVGVGAGAAAVVVALLLWTPLLSSVAARSHSMHVRAVYWRATGPMIARAPLLGVGLDNWQDHYFQTKSDVQQETKKAHNDYLQILAETGVVGFLALAGILVLGLRKALVRDAAPEPEKADPPRGLLLSIVALLTLIGVLQAGDAIGIGIAIVLGTAWIGAWLLLNRAPGPADTTWTRLGLAGGLIGFMVHMVVDFQLYETGVAAALVAVLALIAMTRGGAADVRLPKAVCGAATAVLLLVSAPLLIWITPRVMAADRELEETQAALTSIDAGWVADLSVAISDAVRMSQSAQAHNPLHSDTYLLFARAKFREWSVLKQKRPGEIRPLEECQNTLLQALENAIKLRPLSSPLHEEIAHYHFLFHRYYLKAGKTAELASAKSAEHLRQATDYQARAVQLYPTYSRNAYFLGRLAEAARSKESAQHYREALRLGELAGAELENLDRLKLEPIAQARCLRAIGKPLDAHDVLAASLRKEIRGLTPQDAVDRIKRVLRDNDEEMDEAMTPMLKDAVDAVLRDLK